MGLLLNEVMVTNAYLELKKKHEKELKDFFAEAEEAGFVYDKESDSFNKNQNIKCCEVIISAETNSGSILEKRVIPITSISYERASRAIERQDKAFAFRVFREIAANSLKLLSLLFDVFQPTHSIDEIRGFGPACLMNFADSDSYSCCNDRSDVNKAAVAGSYEIVTSSYKIHITYFEMTREDYSNFNFKNIV